jgi:hypothetical protein
MPVCPKCHGFIEQTHDPRIFKCKSCGTFFLVSEEVVNELAKKIGIVIAEEKGTGLVSNAEIVLALSKIPLALYELGKGETKNAGC